MKGSTMENYHVLELIGEGSFGRVYKGRKKYSGQVVALKFIPKVGRSEKELKNLRREIEIMRGLHHSNIIEMLDSFETEKEVVAVTDYAEGELFQILEDDGNLPEEQVQSIAGQLVSALYYLHSHRILHRDMKPQNILLGKGGIVKLCDFGFARAMSINTLVLTSIKGTPLYMSPELVEEKPYDHTADLWALGCILYELFTGQPPFYTNSIFQLVSLIIKDPVRWPKNMSPVFKDFLQGLLTKNPRTRLSWPLLLEHPFVAQGVKVSEADKNLPSPFTRAPTASLIMEKDKQVKERAHPPGTSKILSKAREKAAEQEAKTTKKKKQEKIEAWGKEPGAGAGNEPIPVHPERPLTQQWDNSGSSQVAPTPRNDRISKDYAQEYPSIEVESRKVLNKPEKKNIENVKLNEEEATSDDEWEHLVETSDPDTDPDKAASLLQEKAFLTKLKARLQSYSLQVLDGMLEGASRLRPALRVVTNLLTNKCELDVLVQFLSSIDCPCHLLTLIEQILQKPQVKEQPWCQQILLDLVTTLHAYFACDLVHQSDLSQDSVKQYVDSCDKFTLLLPRLITQRLDKDLRLREQTLMCMIYVVETMERIEETIANQVFEVFSRHKEALQAIIHGTMVDEGVLKRLEDAAEGQSDLAQQRMEDMIVLNAATLAAVTHLPVQSISGIAGKRKIAETLAQVMVDKKHQQITQGYILLLNHPTTCSNVLKVMYSCLQASSDLCKHFGADHGNVRTLLGILQGKVELTDMECNTVLEMVLHTLSVLALQLEDLPPDLADAAPFLLGIFIESQLASHTAAAALLFSQLLYRGGSVEVPADDLLSAATSELTDLTQICVRCPLDVGVLDGIILLLSNLLTQGEVPVASMFIESGIWGLLWHRTAQMLQVHSPDADLPIHDIEAESGTTARVVLPDWSLVSFQGLLGILQMAISIFTKETFQVVPSLGSPDGIITLTMMHLLSPNFLNALAQMPSLRAQHPDPVADVVLQVTQLCCFPFAVDTNEEILTNVQMSFIKNEMVGRLLQACVFHLSTDHLELPMGLLSRLVLGEVNFVEHFALAVNAIKAVPFLQKAMDVDNPNLSVICDTVSICSHLVRTSPTHVQLLMEVFRGEKGDYAGLEAILFHEHPVVRSRACSMLGNMMKHSSSFYIILKDRPKIMQALIECLKDEDPNVRKSASYALGNAGFHSSGLYSQLKSAIKPLISALEDPVAKTRANVASALGNLAVHSGDLSPSLVQMKAVNSILEVACHDSQYGVQEAALTALRSMSGQQMLRKELKKCHALDKLSSMSRSADSGTPHPRASFIASKSMGRQSITTVMQHCARLVNMLSAE